MWHWTPWAPPDFTALWLCFDLKSSQLLHSQQDGTCFLSLFPSAARGVLGWRGHDVGKRENDTASTLHYLSLHLFLPFLFRFSSSLLFPLLFLLFCFSLSQTNTKRKKVFTKMFQMDIVIFSFPPTPFSFSLSKGKNDFIPFNSPTSIPFHPDLLVGRKRWN